MKPLRIKTDIFPATAANINNWKLPSPDKINNLKKLQFAIITYVLLYN